MEVSISHNFIILVTLFNLLERYFSTQYHSMTSVNVRREAPASGGGGGTAAPTAVPNLGNGLYALVMEWDDPTKHNIFKWIVGSDDDKKRLQRRDLYNLRRLQQNPMTESVYDDVVSIRRKFWDAQTSPDPDNGPIPILGKAADDEEEEEEDEEGKAADDEEDEEGKAADVEEEDEEEKEDEAADKKNETFQALNAMEKTLFEHQDVDLEHLDKFWGMVQEYQTLVKNLHELRRQSMLWDSRKDSFTNIRDVYVFETSLTYRMLDGLLNVRINDQRRNMIIDELLDLLDEVRHDMFHYLMKQEEEERRRRQEDVAVTGGVDESSDGKDGDEEIPSRKLHDEIEKYDLRHAFLVDNQSVGAMKEYIYVMELSGQLRNDITTIRALEWEGAWDEDMKTINTFKPLVFVPGLQLPEGLDGISVRFPLRLSFWYMFGSNPTVSLKVDDVNYPFNTKPSYVLVDGASIQPITIGQQSIVERINDGEAELRDRMIHDMARQTGATIATVRDFIPHVVDNIEDQAAFWEQVSNQVRSRINSVSQDVVQAQRAYERAKSMTEQSWEELQGTEKSLSSFYDTFYVHKDTVKTLVGELETDNINPQNERITLENVFVEALQNLDNAEKTRENLTALYGSTVTYWEQTLKALEQLIEALRDVEYTSVVSEAKRNRVKTEGIMTNISQELKAIKEKNTDHKTRIQNVRNEMKTWQHQYQEVTRLADELKRYEDKFSSSVEEVSSWESIKERLTPEVSKLEDEVESLKDEVGRLQAQVERHKFEIENLRSKVESLEFNVRVKINENSSLESINHESGEKRQELESSIQELEEKRQELESTNREMVEKRQELESATSKLEETQQELVIAERAVEETRQESVIAERAVVETRQALNDAIETMKTSVGIDDTFSHVNPLSNQQDGASESKDPEPEPEPESESAPAPTQASAPTQAQLPAAPLDLSWEYDYEEDDEGEEDNGSQSSDEQRTKQLLTEVDELLRDDYQPHRRRHHEEDEDEEETDPVRELQRQLLYPSSSFGLGRH